MRNHHTMLLSFTLYLRIHKVFPIDHMSSGNSPGRLGYIDDYSTQLYRDEHRWLLGSLVTNQDFIESNSCVFSWLLSLYIKSIYIYTCYIYTVYIYITSIPKKIYTYCNTHTHIFKFLCHGLPLWKFSQAQDFPKAFLQQSAGLVMGTLCLLRDPEARGMGWW